MTNDDPIDWHTRLLVYGLISTLHDSGHLDLVAYISTLEGMIPRLDSDSPDTARRLKADIEGLRQTLLRATE